MDHTDISVICWNLAIVGALLPSCCNPFPTALSFRWQTVALWKGEELPNRQLLCKTWPRHQPVSFWKTRRKRRGYVLFLIQTTSDIIPLHFLATPEANGLFVLPWEFSKPEDNSFKENDETAMLLPLAMGKKIPACFNWVAQLLLMTIFLFVCRCNDLRQLQKKLSIW